jgi:K+-sensing histidine kinase KdpD
MLNAIDRFLTRLMRNLLMVTPDRPRRERDEVVQPGERSRLPISRRVGSYILAVALPTASAAAMIPIRADHGLAAVVILVMPVLIVAVLGATGPAVIAAVTASLAYDLLLTAPYYHVKMDEFDEIVAAISLGTVGLVVGVLTSRLVRLAARDAARRTEITHLVEFARVASTAATEHELVDAACRHIAGVLALRQCRWSPGYHGDVGPVLLPNGNIMGFVLSLNPDRAMLPSSLELPASVGATELGRFILTSEPDHISSREERLTAASIAALFASALARLTLRAA